jgi:hypothetical protein
MSTPGGQNLHVRVPLVLLRTGVGLGALLPEEARRRLAENGVDLHAFAGKRPDEFVQAVMDLNLNMHTPGGPSLRMFCE